MDKNKIIKHIRAERIDIVEADGLVKMSLFNSQNIPPALMDGADILPGHRQDSGISGVMFYNSEGDECGGLVFGSEKLPCGGYRSGLSMTFDQYKNDQVIQISLDEDDKMKSYGLSIFDRHSANIQETIALGKAINETDDPEEKKRLAAILNSQNVLRMHTGKSPDGSVGVSLYDKKGKARIRVFVDKDDTPRIVFYDGEGNETPVACGNEFPGKPMGKACNIGCCPNLPELPDSFFEPLPEGDLEARDC